MNRQSHVFFIKLKAIRLRAKHAWKWIPTRSRRIGQHLKQFCWSSLSWWLAFVYLLLDLLFFPEIYETLADWIKWRTRPLTSAEYKLLYPIFRNSIQYDRVRIDERAYLGPPQLRICYVSFYTINAWGVMGPALLVHEMVHVWQFQQWGSVYIPKALAAQRSKAGYNYGGAPAIVNAAQRGALLIDFNPEQQGDIIADYWRLANGYHVQWGPAGPADLPAYAYFAEQLKD